MVGVYRPHSATCEQSTVLQSSAFRDEVEPCVTHRQTSWGGGGGGQNMEGGGGGQYDSISHAVACV